MGIIQRQSIKGTVVYILGAGLHFFTTVYLMQKFLPEADLSCFRVYFSTIMILSWLGTLGISASVIQNIPLLKNNVEELKPFNFATLLLTFAGAILCVAIIYGLKYIVYDLNNHTNAYLLNYFYCIPIGSFFSVLLIYFESYSLGTHRLTAPSIVRELILKGILFASTFAYYKNLISINTFFILFALSYAICALIMAVYCVLIRNYSLKIDFSYLKSTNFKKYIPYAFYMFCTSVLAALMLYSDQPLIYKIKGSNATVTYSLAVTLASMITIPYKPISSILLPFMYEAWKEKDYKKLNEISIQSCVNLTAIGVLTYLLIIVNLNNITNSNIIQQNYIGLISPLLILGLGRVLDFMSGNSTELMYSAPTYKYTMIYMLISFISSIIIYILLVPKYNEIGMAIGFSAQLLIFNTLKYFHLKSRYKLNAYPKEAFTILLIGVLIYGINLLVPNGENWFIDCSIRSSVLIIIYIASIYYLKIIPFLNSFIDSKLFKN